jgi:hypothetical protein
MPVLSMRRGSSGLTLTTLHACPRIMRGLTYIPMTMLRIFARVSGSALVSISRMS